MPRYPAKTYILGRDDKPSLVIPVHSDLCPDPGKCGWSDVWDLKVRGSIVLIDAGCFRRFYRYQQPTISDAIFEATGYRVVKDDNISTPRWYSGRCIQAILFGPRKDGTILANDIAVYVNRMGGRYFLKRDIFKLFLKEGGSPRKLKCFVCKGRILNPVKSYWIETRSTTRGYSENVGAKEVVLCSVECEKENERNQWAQREIHEAESKTRRAGLRCCKKMDSLLRQFRKAVSQNGGDFDPMQLKQLAEEFSRLTTSAE